MHTRGFIKHATLLVVLLGFLVIFFFKFAQFFKPSAFVDKASNAGSYSDGGTNPLLDFQGVNDSYTNAYNNSSTDISSANRSPYAGRVYLSSGNASYAYQSYEEYVTIRNSGAPVTVTGWVLANSKGARPIENSGNNYLYPVNDSAVIGQGTEYLSPEGVYTNSPIVLKTGDSAYVITGGPFIQFRMPITTSFRENICLGYIDDDYPWSPQVRRDCPTPSQDPSITSVTQECYDYVKNLNRCEDPERGDKNNFDLQRTPCKDFIRERFTYQGCVAKNSNKPGFTTNQWRIFLGKKSQLWRDENEIITLYDAQGRIVDQVKY